MNQSDKPSTHLIYCFICGIAYKSNGFVLHYKECTESYNKLPMSISRPIEEPESISAIISKLQLGEDYSAELDDYNQIAESVTFELLAKECPKCHVQFLPENYLKHAEKCRSRMRKKTLEFEDVYDYTNKNQIEKKQKTRRKKSMDDLKLITKDEIKKFKIFHNMNVVKYVDAPY